MNPEPIFDLAHLGHMELLTPKPDESLKFFVDVMGMTVSGRKGESVYLRGWDDYERYSLKLTASKASGMEHMALRARSPPGTPRPAGTQRSSLIRSSAGMAVGTLVSRGTGFLRTLVLVYAVGIGALGNAYNNANTLPNTVYYLMLGGIFTSVVVPLLVRAARRDPDRGEAYAQRIFTLGALALLAVTVLATLLAGPLVDLYAGNINGPPGSHLAAEHNLMVVWAYWFIPQIFFYGMSSLIGAVLNTRGRFAAPYLRDALIRLCMERLAPAMCFGATRTIRCR